MGRLSATGLRVGAESDLTESLRQAQWEFTSQPEAAKVYSVPGEDYRSPGGAAGEERGPPEIAREYWAAPNRRSCGKSLWDLGSSI
jgi:hypothetical protein